MTENDDTPQRQFTGLWIPRRLVEDNQITPLEKLLVAEIFALQKGKDGCVASNEHLAKHTHMTPKSVSNSIAKLRTLGYLFLVKFDGRRRWLRVNPLALDDELDSIPRLMLSPSGDGSRLHRGMDINKSLKRKQNNEYPLPPELSELKSEWDEWLQHRREIHKPMTPKTFARQMAQLRGWGIAKGRAAIEQSIANSYQGLFPPRADRAPLPEQLQRLSDSELRKRRETAIDQRNVIFREYGKNPQGAVGQRKRDLWKQQQAIEAEQQRRAKA